jgi:hypothetical protein
MNRYPHRPADVTTKSPETIAQVAHNSPKREQNGKTFPTVSSVDMEILGKSILMLRAVRQPFTLHFSSSFASS